MTETILILSIKMAITAGGAVLVSLFYGEVVGRILAWELARGFEKVIKKLN